MDEGWETRRRRDTGHDWVRYRLTAQAAPRAVGDRHRLSTRGTHAGWAALYGLDATSGADPADHTSGLGRTPAAHPPPARYGPPLRPRWRPPPVTHVRIDIYPDGGVARLRLHGTLTEHGAQRLAARHAELSGWLPPRSAR
ncbi:putative allantoicase OS=Streptomyces antimycoticus OX=68175 GN=alc PE=3 SV=1 [Streptomyces antimycoticus]